MNFDKKKVFKDTVVNLIPQIEHFYFFNEVDIFPESTRNTEEKIRTNTLKNSYRYEHFLKQKNRRPIYDMYACFQPFNEALKALFPFLKQLKLNIKKGDVILNLWDRSGWLTSVLSGLFPEQHIITTWEGNKDVLGYQGFYFWMKDLKNVSVLFCDLNKPLPLKDKSIAFAVGLDAFHRFDQLVMLNELLRVVYKDGAILFPHVHLSNAEPDPFFERGCKQIHGRDYQSAFNTLLKHDTKEGFIFSEPELFIANDITVNSSITVTSSPSTKDYNALIAILPKFWKDITLSSFSLEDLPVYKTSRLIINALLNISLHQQKVIIDSTRFGGNLQHLLERHPVYVDRIKALGNLKLSELATKLIYLAQKAFTIEEMCVTTNVSEAIIIKELSTLEHLGLLQVLPLSESGLKLQNYIMTQDYSVPSHKQTLKHLWHNTVHSFGENTALIALQDESEYTYEDCNAIIPSIQAALDNASLKKNDRIVICNPLHAEAILLFWACMHAGIVVVPIADHLTDTAIATILEQTEAKYLFTNESYYLDKKSLFKTLPTVLFDYDDALQNDALIYFADWLENAPETTFQTEKITPCDNAVILYTSGSTGTPKGVQLSHGNLYRSGRHITETFHWKAIDRFFALGGLESMSGLRNASISALHVGAAVVIPKENTKTNLFAITESIAASNSTILASNPAFLRQTIKYKDKIRGQLDTIQTLMCTGNILSLDLRTAFKMNYNLSILNYYGLSETSGICISQSPTDATIDIDTIGKPIGCIAQIVDENDRLVPFGEKGELRIYSDTLMKGYLKDETKTASVLKNGWFYTQDNAKYIEGGYIQLLGRKRNIVKTATEELIYLDVIQQFLQEQPFIEDCHVSAYTKEDHEKVVAFLVLQKEFYNQEKAVKQKTNTLLAKAFGIKKIPNQLIILNELPYNSNGKLLKQSLLNAYL